MSSKTTDMATESATYSDTESATMLATCDKTWSAVDSATRAVCIDLRDATVFVVLRTLELEDV
jgi:hypothetical protein